MPRLLITFPSKRGKFDSLLGNHRFTKDAFEEENSETRLNAGRRFTKRRRYSALVSHGCATLQSHSRRMKTKNQKEISHMKLNMAAALKKNNQSLAAALGKNKRLNTTHSVDV